MDNNDVSYSAEAAYNGDWESVWAQDITVASANDFGIKNSELYKGVVATFTLGGDDIGKVESIKVEVFDAENTLLATNILKSDKLPKSAGNLTSPIVAIEGTYKYGSWYKTEWAEGYPDPLTPPSYVRMTLTDNNALTYSAEESNLHTIYSAGGDWASLWGIDHIVTNQSELDDAIVKGGYIYITAENNTLTLGKNMNIGEDTVIDLAGSTQYIQDSIKAYSGQNLTMKNGTVVKNTTNGKVRFDTKKDTSDNQTVMFENITFSNIVKFSSSGSSSNATDNMIQIVPSGGKGTYTFKNCIFENAYVDINGLSGVELGDIKVNFDNCKFNNWGNANTIQIGAYAKGEVSVTSCTFDIKSTSNVSIVSNPFSKTTVSISNSSVNGVKVEANESEGIKVFPTQSVKLGNVNTDEGITYSGSAEGFYVGK